MKQRLMTAAIGMVVLAIVLLFFETIGFNIVIAILAMLAVHEVLLATKFIENKSLAVVCILFAGGIPFFTMPAVFRLLPLICYTFIFALFVILLLTHRTMRIEQMGFAVFMTLCISFSLTTAVNIRNGFGLQLGLFYLFLSLGGAWLTDSGAYFVGRAFGKHKLAPSISPNKTIEGVFGGITFNVVSFFLLSLAFTYIWGLSGVKMEVNYFRVFLVSLLSAGASIVGDLSASIIKRQCGVKDFGHIMPGHGGVMDRFDSVLFVMPLIYIIANIAPLAVIK